MKTYFALFLIATIASLITTPLIRRLCQRYKILDVPADARRLHRLAIPRLGGLALYFSCLTALSVLPLLDNLLTQTLSGLRSEFLMIFVPATLVLMLGAYDDLRGTNAIVKFAGVGMIATVFYALGGRIDALSIPLFGPVELPPLISFLFTIVWLVGITNAFNLIDGLDGLASGAALFSSLVILGVSISQERPLMIVIALVLCGAIAGFLRYNFNPASIFLGDSGALFIGFLLAAMSVLGTQKASTAVAIFVPILAFGFPVVDTAMAMARRFVSGKPVFEGDNEHIHHMLLARGWSQRRVALVLYGVCAAFGLVALMFPATGSKLTGFMLFVISVAVIIAVGHLRYHEVEEIRAGVKRTVGDRRLRVANNIRVRRTALALSKASDLHEMFEALRHMLDFGEFTFANAQVGQAGRAEINERAYQASLRRHPKQELELRNGRVFWSWSKEGSEPDERFRSRAEWSFRLPLVKDGVEWGWLNFYHSLDGEALLVDTNYLSDLFRREFTEAAARIFAVHEVPEAAPAMVMHMAAKG
ncbi:MAG: undecaprenyl/decaprenyl-phosphate alpha-N-acetylglucosaminyl 1-phosphate transferase [Acidobacteria bacterium]|nr:undecaprenyl/decaprenyl-phosphate alpha-N-acetylglucosaminyl 1-phosphate transferase [Acidobacteriota bacterium]